MRGKKEAVDANLVWSESSVKSNKYGSLLGILKMY